MKDRQHPIVDLLVITLVAAATIIFSGPGAAVAAQPTGLSTFHRSGQTFVTWFEDTASSGESYHVYRHAAPINAGNLGQATRLTDTWGPLPEGSG
ncbi:MAG: hypothetical protein GY856_37200, partial [bacterium]|nr:hypothetical protein [bacterium]